jgi:hypothetical protein
MQVLDDALYDAISARERRPRRQLHNRDEVALVLRRNEAAWRAPELNARQDDEPGVDHEH